MPGLAAFRIAASSLQGNKLTPLEQTKHKEVLFMSKSKIQVLDPEQYEKLISEKKYLDYLTGKCDKDGKYKTTKINKQILPEEKPTAKAISLQQKREMARSKFTDLDNAVEDAWNDNTEKFNGKFNSREDLLSYLQSYKATPFRINEVPNAIKMKTRNCGLTIESTTEFNAIVKACEKYIDHKMEFTPSNAIKMARQYTKHEGWGVRYTSKGIPELIIISFRGMWRFQYRGAGKKPPEYGTQSWKNFTKDCKEAGINLEEIAVPAEQAMQVKNSIPKPHIKCLRKGYIDKELDNVHFIDLHSAYPTGIAEEFPQLRPVLYKYYTLRRKYKAEGKVKQEEKMKQRLVNISGMSESEFVKYRYSKMAKAAKERTNQKLEALIQEITEAGSTPILTNTDGIYYRGELHKFANEGDDMGQLQPKTTTKFRMKSAGAYEYLDEKGKYHCSLRGRTALDLVKRREDWSWGDIYQTGAVIKFTYNYMNLQFELNYDVEE